MLSVFSRDDGTLKKEKKRRNCLMSFVFPSFKNNSWMSMINIGSNIFAKIEMRLNRHICFPNLSTTLPQGKMRHEITNMR